MSEYAAEAAVDNSNGSALKILVVEDESMIAMLLEHMLQTLGHEVTIACGLDEALRLAGSGTFDAAILDVNLDGKPSYPVAALLKGRGISFAFTTGYGPAGIDPRFAGVPALAKPFASGALEKLLAEVEHRSRL
jgi:CheY-like chemotaxis protein